MGLTSRCTDKQVQIMPSCALSAGVGFPSLAQRTLLMSGPDKLAISMNGRLSYREDCALSRESGATLSQDTATRRR